MSDSADPAASSSPTSSSSPSSSSSSPAASPADAAPSDAGDAIQAGGAAAVAERFLNRELSWLEFNQRVLDEAADTSVPLADRLKFLGITASNLDEFFRVRVGSLDRVNRLGSTVPDIAGLTPEEQLERIFARSREMMDDQYRLLARQLQPALAEAGLVRSDPSQLPGTQRRRLLRVFEDEILPVLSPIAVRHGGDFPTLPSETACLAVELVAKPDEIADAGDDEPEAVPPTDAANAASAAGEASVPPGASVYAILPLGPSVRRFYDVEVDGRHGYVLLEDLVLSFLGRFFVGRTVRDTAVFRVTRNADITVEDDESIDLMSDMESMLEARTRGRVVRLELPPDCGGSLRELLVDGLGMDDREVIEIDGPPDLKDFLKFSFRDDLARHREEDWPPVTPIMLRDDADLFDEIARRDQLLIHPFESFDPVVRLIEQAADDPDVLAIKQTLYRTSGDSAIVSALLRACQNGKHVTAVVELKARFDEARNIERARDLEDAGAQVIYGVKRLKTHAKALLIVRREPHRTARYVHLGTGNYNESTARLYSDVSLMTCEPDLARDVVAFFNVITGYSEPHSFRELAIAPLSLRKQLLELIEGEAERSRQGQDAWVRVKANSLADPALIEALYEASQAGVKVELNIRGICCLRPGVPGLSENIRVVRVIDRYLEHTRMFAFHHGGSDLVFISSADWMPRNLDRRIELLVPILEEAHRRRLLAMFATYMQDNVKATVLLSDGQQRPVEAGTRTIRSQRVLYERAKNEAENARAARLTMFEPHVPQ